MGTTLRHGATVALKRPDGAKIPCTCCLQKSAPKASSPSDTASLLSSAEGDGEGDSETCTWDTHISLVAVLSSQLPMFSSAPLLAGDGERMPGTGWKNGGLELAIFDDDLRRRLRVALELGLKGQTEAFCAHSSNMRPPVALLLHGPAGVRGGAEYKRHVPAGLDQAVCTHAHVL